MRQKVLSMSTTAPNLRSEAVGWTYEDSARVVPGPIGCTSSLNGAPFHAYDCVLRALNDGWKLLAPPERQPWTNSEGQESVEWTWWLVKE